jgi:putative glutamine amidotransferase
MEKELFELKGVHVLGVYHPDEIYAYEQSEDYLRQHPDLPFSLKSLQGDLNPGNLYMENECTSAFEELFNGSVGALFMGGPDLPPVIYNEPVHLLTVVTDPYRHYLEASFLFHLLGGSQNPEWEPYMEMKRHYLINGICLGMQTLNVATGGTLVQDIPTELYHIWLAEEILALPPEQMHRNYADKLYVGCQDPTSYHFHPIMLKRSTFLTRNIGFKQSFNPMVLSSHHQSLEQLGKGWEVAATSMDGKVIEAIQHAEYPHVFGVQFHPENPGLFDPSIEHPLNCYSSINFLETIAQTASYDFHAAYWKYLGQVLKDNGGE